MHLKVLEIWRLHFVWTASCCNKCCTIRALCGLALSSMNIGLSANAWLSKWGTTRGTSTLSRYFWPVRLPSRTYVHSWHYVIAMLDLTGHMIIWDRLFVHGDGSTGLMKVVFVTPYRRSCKGLAPTKHFISRIIWWWRRLITVRVLMWPSNTKLPRSAPAVLNGRCRVRLDMSRSSLSVDFLLVWYGAAKINHTRKVTSCWHA
jgi:hypothetical protein